MVACHYREPPDYGISQALHSWHCCSMVTEGLCSWIDYFLFVLLVVSCSIPMQVYCKFGGVLCWQEIARLALTMIYFTYFSIRVGWVWFSEKCLIIFIKIRWCYFDISLEEDKICFMEDMVMKLLTLPLVALIYIVNTKYVHYYLMYILFRTGQNFKNSCSK